MRSARRRRSCSRAWARWRSIALRAALDGAVVKPSPRCDAPRMSNRKTRQGEALSWGVLDGSVGPRVRLLRNVLSARSIAVSAPFGLPTGALTVLALISANPGSSQSALAGRAGLNKSALVGIIDQLEALGLAARARSE